MNSRDLERLIGLWSIYPPYELERRMRTLRERDEIAYGPRGRHAPNISSVEAVVMLFAMASRKAADAASTAIKAMQLRPVPDGGELTFDQPLGKLLAYVLEGMLSDRDDLRVEQVEIESSARYAWVTFKYKKQSVGILFSNDEKIREDAEQDHDNYVRIGHIYFGHRVGLPGALFDQIALEMKGGTERGWVGNSDSKRAAGHAHG